jgi:hypothetical protein
MSIPPSVENRTSGPPRGRVAHDGGVELARDRGLRLDQNGLDGVAADGQAEDRARRLRRRGRSSAGLTPPALPRLPAGTCALTTTGP